MTTTMQDFAGVVSARAGEALAAFNRGDYALVCVTCKTPVFMVAGPRAMQTGHCYSTEGAKEFYISGACEWCFDKMFDPDWTEPDLNSED